MISVGMTGDYRTPARNEGGRRGVGLRCSATARCRSQGAVVAEDGQPRFNVVKTYAFDDWGIYGRGDELLCRALARHQAVGRVFHVQPPADPASFRQRFQAPVWGADVE